MSSITRQRVGKYTYLYESTSFRDELGRPRNKKVRIGKIDPKTGQAVYLPEFLERMAAMGTPIAIPHSPIADDESFSNAQVIQVIDSTKDFGAFYFLHELANQLGILSILQEAFPSQYQEIFTLACFLAVSKEPVMYCQDWVSQTETLNVRSMTSQRISELFSGMSMEQRDIFYRSWSRQTQEDGYIALDITSVSSYSELIRSCEWGYNRDRKNLPQVNLCMLYGENTQLPIYQTAYSGSLKDVTTLRTTLAEVTALCPDCQLRLVMDKGFFSTKNVNELLEMDKQIHFLVSVPFTHNFAKRQAESERKDIDRLENTILTGNEPIRGVHKLRSWGKDGIRLHTFIYFNPSKELKERNELYGYVTELKAAAMWEPENPKLQSDYEKYLIIRNSSQSPSGITVNIREDVVREKLKTCGWMVLISDSIEDIQEALDVYRTKDVVEKSFYRLKNSLDLRRLRVQNDERMENKLFVGFISLILIGAIHKGMRDKGLYRNMTMHEMLLKLAKLRSATINGTRILLPVTKEQRLIFEAFGIKLPVG